MKSTDLVNQALKMVDGSFDEKLMREAEEAVDREYKELLAHALAYKMLEKIRNMENDRYKTRLTLNRPVPLEVQEWLRQCETILDKEINKPEVYAQVDRLEEIELRRMIYGTHLVEMQDTEDTTPFPPPKKEES